MFLSTLNKAKENDINDGSYTSGVEVYNQKRRDSDIAQREGLIKNKIQFLSKMAKMQRTLREQRESILKIKFFNDNKLPQGILLEGKDAVERFLAFKTYDSVNEKYPNYFDD